MKVSWKHTGDLKYRVHIWSDGIKNETEVSSNAVNLTNLTPGVRYTINVTALASDGTEGLSATETVYTRPEMPGNLNVSSRSTDSLEITWTLPMGRVDHYVVNISNADINYSNFTKTNNAKAKFSNLHPGRVFNITVTAVAGDFTDTSEPFSFATYPTPPGMLVISNTTNSSLHLQWSTPDKMDGSPNISYWISYNSPNNGEGEIRSDKYTAELEGLQSGTLYNISVKTVGPEELNSTSVSNSTYTLPNPVQNANAIPISTMSIWVNWSEPLGFQSYYQYLVQTYNSTGALVDEETTNKISYEVLSLEPGSYYSISITTIIGSDTKSAPVKVSNHTMPEPVTDLTASFVNTTSIQLTWMKQIDYKPSYNYLVEIWLGSKQLHNNVTKEETFTFNNLIPGTQYTFKVFTVQENVHSNSTSIEEYTVPEKVSAISATGTTNSMTVSWTKAEGGVSSYFVQISKSKGSMENATVLSNETTQTIFENLKPGVLFDVQVVTRSGPKENNISVSNATFPTPPGPIMVDFQTNSSINFTWSLPADMDPQQYTFRVSAANYSYYSQNNWWLLENLLSGRSYIIYVVTVGVLGYESTPEMTQNYTKPNSVRNLTETKITTTSVTLKWNQPDSTPPFNYEVQVKNDSDNSKPSILTNNTMVTVANLESGSNHSFTVTTLTADSTRAESVIVSYYTKPYNITDLNASTLSTTAIYLNWTQPHEHKPYYKYWVNMTGCSNRTENTSVENITFSALTPGTNCHFCVSVMVPDGSKGKKTCSTQYTKPEVVQPRISSEGSSDSVLVTWAIPAGNVEHYIVQLNGSSPGLPKDKNLTSKNTSFLFTNLSAAVLYSTVVKSCSGPFSESSEMVTNATFPNPPGPIEILEKKTDSFTIRWGEAPLMDFASNYSYKLVYNVSQVVWVYPAKTNYNLSELHSGTSYNITVKTVGPLDFESQSVHKCSSTRPHKVTSLITIPEEKSIIVNWTKPAEHKSTYRFVVTWQSSDGSNKRNITTNETEYKIAGLTPGSEYNIGVTTETSDGTQSDTETVSICTNASPVRNLTCDGPNSMDITGDAELILNWKEPDGMYSNFMITVSNGTYDETRNVSSLNTIFKLAYHSVYNIKVETQSCGNSSILQKEQCMTGVSKPPIPADYKNLHKVTSRSHKTFTVQIEAALIDNSRGPVTHVGLLVTSDDNANNSNLEQYLKKTYENWRNKLSNAYLATITNYTQMSRSSSAVSNLEIEVGSGSKWESYTNDVLDPSGSYKYAIVIFTNLRTDSGKIDTHISVFSITNFSSVILLDKDPANIPLAIGVTLGIFGVLFVILIGFIIYWRRLSHKESPDIQIQSMGGKVSVAVRVEDFEAYYRKQKADSSCGFAEEFEDLKPVGTAQAKLHALALENKPKNRYNNVLPYDSSRVKLSVVHGSPNEDYINANYMPGYLSRKEYIAAQGPLPVTVNEFWRMVWEKNVQTLVMLTRCNEQGRVKCEQYWGPDTKHCGDIIVTTTSEIPLEDWTIRDFDIKNVKTTEVRSVRHFHFTAWPDHGVPETTELLISFRHLVREHMNQYSRNSPTVVHCSAGVGRTGTFIAIDRLIFQIERENIVDVYGIVHDLRMHRPLMVQTEDQYVFLNQCALDIIRARTGNNVDLIYQNTAAISIYENVEPKKK